MSNKPSDATADSARSLFHSSSPELKTVSLPQKMFFRNKEEEQCYSQKAFWENGAIVHFTSLI